MATQTEPELIPREVLFGNPTRISPSISPDGSKMAYVAPHSDVLNVWVRTVGEEDDRPVTRDTDRGIMQYFWAKDNRHLLYIQDRGGDENWRLYWVDLTDGDVRDLTPFEGVQVRPIKQSKHHPDEVLIAMNKDNPQLHDAYRLDLGSGELELVARNPGNIIHWVADFHLKMRGAMAATPDGGFDLLYRDSEEDDWQPIVHWDPVDALGSGPLAFTRDGEHLLLQDSRDANAGRLVRLAVKGGSIEVIASDEHYDVADAMIHPDSTEVQMVGFQRARLEWTVLDESIREDVDRINALDRGEVHIFNRDDDDRAWLVGFVPDDGPVAYYAYDRAQKQATFLFHHRPELADYTLAPMEPISYTSRDGLEIHGYLTLPPGAGREKLPLVLNVHGGPWHRDAWGLNVEVQWLANRGYAVLQVNFRGSTGYGKSFLNAGDRQWGGKMHDDLVDAVEWAKEQGVADPGRIAIYGASYGGYAALCGATMTPELFRCALSMVGPSSLITFIETIPPYWVPLLTMFKQRVGDPETEADFLRSRSPLTHVDKIRIPMLVAQGANDPRVKQAESEQIVEAMRSKGIDHTYLVFDDEGHGFVKPENRLAFYAAAESFLAKHLGGRAED